MKPYNGKEAGECLYYLQSHVEADPAVVALANQLGPEAAVLSSDGDLVYTGALHTLVSMQPSDLPNTMR